MIGLSIGLTTNTPSIMSGIHYQRVLPWDQNDSGVDYLVTWHKDQGTYNYTPPASPAKVAMLANNYTGSDAASLLASGNAFSNRYRFTNDEGEQFTEGFESSGSNTSSNPRYCIDHLTGLAYYVQDAYNDKVDRTIGEAATYVHSFSYAGYSDWRLADASEYIVGAHYHDYHNAYTASYVPFVDDQLRDYGGQLWYGTYTRDNQYLSMQTNGGLFVTRNNTQVANHLMMVRNHYIS